jgi:hypothetical protein
MVADKKYAYRWMALCVMSICAIACSHTPSASDIPPGAAFTANILADDTKLFTYSQRFTRDGSELYGETDYASMENPRTLRAREGMRKAVMKASHNGLEAMLAQNNYCRDDYMVLEQYEQHGTYIIRGECRDAATHEDREKFSRR